MMMMLAVVVVAVGGQVNVMVWEDVKELMCQLSHLSRSHE